jgi:hypothetical protein
MRASSPDCGSAVPRLVNTLSPAAFALRSVMRCQRALMWLSETLFGDAFRPRPVEKKVRGIVSSRRRSAASRHSSVRNSPRLAVICSRRWR